MGGASNADSTGTATSISITYSPTKGNTLVIFLLTVLQMDITTLTVSDNGSGSVYVPRHAFFPLSGGSQNLIAITTSPGGVGTGVTSITLNYSGAGASKAVAIVEEYSGVAAFGLIADNASFGGATTSATETATITDNGDMLVMGVGSNGTGTFSSGTGTLRRSAVTSGGATLSNIGGALVEITGSGNRQQNSPAATISTSQTWATLVIELKAASPCFAGGNFVQGAQSSYLTGDSNAGLFMAAFSQPTKSGNLVIVAAHWATAVGTITIKDFLNTWKNRISFTSQDVFGFWDALPGVPTQHVIFQTPSNLDCGSAELYIAEYSVPPGTMFDASNSSGSASGTALDSGNVAILSNWDLLIGFGHSVTGTDTLTPGATFNTRIQDSAVLFDLLEDSIISSPAHATETNNNSHQWGMLGVAYALGGIPQGYDLPQLGQQQRIEMVAHS